MLLRNLKEGILEEHLQEAGGHLDNNLLPKDPLPDSIKIGDMKGTSEGHPLDRINTVNHKEDMRIDQDPNIQKERGNIEEGNHKEGNIKRGMIEEGDIHHNKEGNIKRDMIGERHIHRNKEGTLNLNIDGIHKVSTTNKEWHRKFHLGVMKNPGIEDLLQGKEKEAVVEEIIVQIAAGKFTVIQTVAFYVDGARKQREEEPHRMNPEEMMTPRGKDIKGNHKEEVPHRGGKDR
jgi:hypothetical protein